MNLQRSKRIWNFQLKGQLNALNTIRPKSKIYHLGISERHNAHIKMMGNQNDIRLGNRNIGKLADNGVMPLNSGENYFNLESNFSHTAKQMQGRMRYFQAGKLSKFTSQAPALGRCATKNEGEKQRKRKTREEPWEISSTGKEVKRNPQDDSRGESQENGG